MKIAEFKSQCLKKYNDQGDDHKKGREFDVLADVILNECGGSSLEDILEIFEDALASKQKEAISEAIQNMDESASFEDFAKEVVYSVTYEDLANKIR